MRQSLITCISAAALLGAAGCGSDNGADSGRAATTATATMTTPSAVTTTTDERSQTTTTTTGTDERLSPEGRAVLAAAQDLAADVGQTAQGFARGRIDRDEAMARLDLASERAGDLRRRAQQLPATDRARTRLASLSAEISRTADAVSKLVASGRDAGRDEIDKRIADLRGEARSTVDALAAQLDERAQKRFRKALDRIGAGVPG